MPGFNIVGNDRLQPIASVETHRSHRWRIDSLISDSVFLKSGFDKLLYARDVQLPSIEFETLEAEGGSIKYKYASFVGFSDVVITFYDIYGLLEPLNTLVASVWDTNIGLKPASEYKGQCDIKQLDNAGNPNIQYKLNNAWIKKLSHSTLSYTNSEIKSIELTIAYDWLEVAVINSAAYSIELLNNNNINL